ncbi:hypothetical protein NE664_14365 [Anaerotignum faecicola]|nr:hypothetical protein [Anaerotignum faecicola]
MINSGSSSLKFQVIDPETEDVLAKGVCEPIGIDGIFTYRTHTGISPEGIGSDGESYTGGPYAFRYAGRCGKGCLKGFSGNQRHWPPSGSWRREVHRFRGD